MKYALALATTLAFLAPASAGGMQGGMNATMPTAMMSNSPDVLWMDATSMSNHMEIMTSRMAITKTMNADVRAFAQRMIMDHTMSQNELRMMASMKGVKIMEMPSSGHRLEAQKLSTMSGMAFDRMYMMMQVMGHRHTVSMFESYLSVGRDAQTLAAARKYLPVIRMHLMEAERLHGMMK
ncbi:hypothetical protein GCM10008955_40470 [Deinococcus malanensis]|uniref:DUF4142 domain-containing protein n=1 Tax=Deinococcus malanensis TaxID=1706855 RepID=A0ABQ2F1T5_9DEIO|nr:DUF4142 domain-containing protein [Deinococcus malanensis]GGK42618.1 hypothetical protein GCM10008955_40470 [Deinococcus malanensis]